MKNFRSRRKESFKCRNVSFIYMYIYIQYLLYIYNESKPLEIFSPLTATCE